MNPYTSKTSASDSYVWWISLLLLHILLNFVKNLSYLCAVGVSQPDIIKIRRGLFSRKEKFNLIANQLGLNVCPPVSLATTLHLPNC